LTSKYFRDLRVDTTKNIFITGFKNEISAVKEQISSTADTYLTCGCPQSSSQAKIRSLVEYCRFSNGTKKYGTIKVFSMIITNEKHL
jgi:hypothetical protein